MGLLGQLAKSLIGGVVVSIHLDAVVDGGSVPMDHLSNLTIAKSLLRELVTEDVAGIDDGHVPIFGPYLFDGHSRCSCHPGDGVVNDCFSGIYHLCS